MLEFFDLISDIKEEYKLVVDVRYSWRTGYDIKVYEDGYDQPVIDMVGESGLVFHLATNELLDKYF